MKTDLIDKIVDASNQIYKNAQGKSRWMACNQETLTKLFGLTRNQIALLKWQNRKWHRENSGLLLVEMV